MARQRGSRTGRCQGCNHLERVRIERLLAAGASIKGAARKFVIDDLRQTKTGTLLGRQGSDFLEDSAGSARNALKTWWVQQDSNLRPAD
jgi:hypothetical protein